MTVQDARNPATPPPGFWVAQSRVRLRTLILLRWLAVLGQTVAVLFVRFGLNVEFPLEWAMAAIGVSVLLNLGLNLELPRGDGRIQRAGSNHRAEGC